MTEREKFEKWLNTLDKQTLVTMAAKQARTIEELQAATKAAVPQFKPFSDKPEYEKPLLISAGGKAKYSAYMLCVTNGCDEWLEEIHGIAPDIIDLETVDGWMYWPLPAAPEVK